MRTRLFCLSCCAALAAGGASVEPLPWWGPSVACLSAQLGIAYVRGQLIAGRRRFRRMVDQDRR